MGGGVRWGVGSITVLFLTLMIPGISPGADESGDSRSAGGNGYHTALDDLQYVARQFYFIADHPLRWQPETLHLFQDDRNPANDFLATPGLATLDPTSPFDSLVTPHHRGRFDQLIPGIDYDLVQPFPARSPGEEIPVLRLRHPVSFTTVLAVYYREETPSGSVDLGNLNPADSIPLIGKEPGSLLLKLIRVSPDLLPRIPQTSRFDHTSAWYSLLHFELRNIYNLGIRGAPRNRLTVRIRRRDYGQPVDPDTLWGRTYLELLGLDRSGSAASPDPSLPDGRIDEEFFDSAEGLVQFPDLHPFDPDTITAGSCPPGRGGFLCLDDLVRNPLREAADYCGGTCGNPMIYYYARPNSLTDSRYYLDVTLEPTPPRAIALLQNRPNPFNPGTRIPFEVRDGGGVAIRVFDLAGRLVREIFSGDLPAGSYESPWDGLDERGRAAPSGVYFCRAELSGQSDSRRMVLIR